MVKIRNELVVIRKTKTMASAGSEKVEKQLRDQKRDKTQRFVALEAGLVLMGFRREAGGPSRTAHFHYLKRASYGFGCMAAARNQ